MDEIITYNEQDGLVLAMIAESKNYDIKAWLAWADGHYKMVLSYNELQSALEKLQRGGLILCKEHKIYCTLRGKMLLLGRYIPNSLEWIFRVQEKLRRLPFRDIAPVCYSLSEAVYNEDLQKYLAWAESMIKSLHTP